MSKDNITTTKVAVQPSDFQMGDMIENIEPYIDSLPHFLRGLIENFKATKFDEHKRREEIREKSKTRRLTSSERQQWEKCKEDLRKKSVEVVETSKSLEQKKALESQLQQKIVEYEALLKERNAEFETKLKERKDHWSKENEKQKEIHNDELRRIKEKHKSDLSEQKKSLYSQMDQQADDYEVLLQKAKDEFEKKLKEKDDYIIAEMSANRNAIDEQKEKCDNEVLRLLDQHQNALVEGKRVHESQLHQLKKEYQQQLKEQSDVYEKKILEREEDIQLAKKKLNIAEQEQISSNQVSDWLRREMEDKEAQFKAEMEQQATNFIKTQQELLLQLQEKKQKIKYLEQSIERTVKRELYQKLEAEYQQKESHLKDWFKKQTVQFGNEKLNLEQHVQHQNRQINDLTTRMEKNKAESQQMKQVLTEELYKKDKELKDYMSRLAAVSEKKVQSDQRKVENTLSRHRQSRIEQEFKDFFDQDRLDACEVARECYRKTTDEEESIYIPRLACLIFEMAYERALSARDGFYNIAQKSILHLVSNTAELGRRWTVCEKLSAFPYNRQDLHVELKDKSDIDSVLAEEICGVVDGIMLLVKEKADSCPLTLLVKDLKESVDKAWRSANTLECLPRHAGYGYFISEGLEDYFEKCVSLAWRMVTQVPPLRIDFKTNTKYDEKLHECVEHHPTMVAKTRPEHGSRSGINPKQEIACYLWPILHDEKKILHKGVVILKLGHSGV